MDPLTIIRRLEDPASGPAPSDDELAQARQGLLEALDAATGGDDPDLDTARDLREAIDKVAAEQASREQAREKAREEARALRADLFPDETTDNEPEAEVAEDEQEDEAEVPEETREPVLASGGAGDLFSRLTARAKRIAPAEEPKAAPGVTVKAVGPAAGFDISEGDGFATLGHLFSTHAKSITGSGSGSPLFRLTRHFDESRTLGHNLELNNRRLADVFGPDKIGPLTAAGGLCGPGDVDHSHPICADRGRPVRDSLPQFNAARGRVTLAPAAGLGDVDGAVSVWTSETDADPGDATKPCPPVECPEDITAAVDAVTRCLTIGNFQAQFSPEFWASRLELLMAAHDRVAEQKIIAEIDAASTELAPVTGGNTLYNVLSTVNNIITSDRSTQRNGSGQYTVLLDEFVRTAIRNDFIANNGSGNVVEAIQVADAQITNWLSTLNAVPVWTQDGTINADGEHRVLDPSAEQPVDTTVYVYPSEAFLFLDGGTLDLGTSITDSTLNATNDRQAFAETFEKTMFRGCSSYKVQVDLASVCGCSLSS